MQTPSGHQTPGYTAQEIENMRIALSKRLGPEFISKRQGPGYSSVQYLEGWKAINIANEIFGPNGWSTELKEFRVDFIEEKRGAYNIGLSCVVRVILKDGTFHEDVGYGSIDNCKSKAMAFDKCKKEAFTDGMKRALRQFGNALGNCLYDKEFLQQITKVASEPSNFDANSLMRRSSTLPKTIAPKLESEVGLTKSKIGTVQSTGTTTTTAAAANNNNNKQSQPLQPQKNGTDEFMNTPGLKAPDAGKPSSPRVKSPERLKDDADDSFIFSDELPDDEEINQQILNSNNFVKAGNDLPSSDFENQDDDEAADMALHNKENMKIVNGTSGLPSETPQQLSNDNDVPVPTHVTFVSATSADTIRQDPTLQTSLKYNATIPSSQLNKSAYINHSKSLPVKKSQIRQEENKENKTITSPGGTGNSGTSIINRKVTKNVFASKPTNPTPSFNPIPTANNNNMAKRYGLPPNMLANKRLKK